jgi:hypothetical protein
MTQPEPPVGDAPQQQEGLLQQVLAALGEFLAAARAALGARPGVPDLDQWPDPHLWMRAVVDRIGPAAAAVAERAYRREAPGGEFADDDRDWVGRYLEGLPNRLAGVPDELYEQVQTAVRDGLDAGDTTADLTGRVQDVLGLGGQRWRAERIARTEAAIAEQGGQYQAALARYGRSSGVRKQWWTALDGRVRPTHRDVHGQVLPLGESFRVGHSLLQHPGDPSGAPGEVIQCRCVLLVLPAGEDPLPVDTRPIGQGDAA